MLADSDSVEDGGKTIIIKLRQGVHFHNGKEMTANDVVASMKRWGKFGARGKLLMANATSVEATGKYEVTLKLSAPNGAWKNLVADVNGGLAIYPEEIAARPAISRSSRKITSAPALTIQGMAAEPLCRAREVRSLQARARKQAMAFAGARVANFDDIRFIPVPDVGTRVSGVQAGDYDYAEMISGDLYDTLSKDKSDPGACAATPRSSASSS